VRSSSSRVGIEAERASAAFRYSVRARLGVGFNSEIRVLKEYRLNEPKILYSKREAAYLLSISLRTLETLITEGHILVCRIGRRVLISSRALSDFSTSTRSSESPKTVRFDSETERTR
jgi:excisionase family DNA binding protein